MNDLNRYNDLIIKIKSTIKLKYLFIVNNECENHLNKCILNVNEYSFLNEYIDLYLKFNPNKINEQRDYYKRTPLILSVYKNNEETFKIILKYTSNINLLDYNNETVLFYVCRLQNTNMMNIIFPLLLNNGIDLNIINNYGETAFFTLCKNKNANINFYKMFLDRNIDINHKNKYNNTAFHFFILYNNDNNEIIKLFYQYGFNFITNKSEKNYNCIDYILINKKYECLKTILYYYDDLDIMSYINFDKFDNKPVKLIKMLYQYYKDDIEIIKIAISKGAKKEDIIGNELLNFYNKL